jgi:uncharacterized protein
MKETGKGKRLEDRLLGDEWSDWQPGSRYKGTIEAPKALFVFFSFLVLISVLSGILLFWYLALPRFEGFGPGAVRAAGSALFFFAAILFIWYLLQVASSLFKVKLVPAFITKRFSLRIFLPGAVKLAGIFGVSRDKTGNSFVKFHNDLMYAARAGRGAKRFLILLPRCLSAETRKGINELGGKYQFKAFTAFGGDEARKIIREERPDAVIGVACERDLISGIQDTSPKIPVFGLPNKRPEGPCKNTSVDLKELEKIIKYCAGI